MSSRTDRARRANIGGAGLRACRRIAVSVLCSALGSGLLVPRSWAAGSTLADSQSSSLAASCVTCHGAARPVKNSGIPSLAGRPANEIELKMRAYAAGNTPGDLMQQIAKGYDAATIGRIARWYAQLKPEVQ
ncbi:c-type cytochrome [Paralcaligenes ginsengisoli]